MRHSIHSKMTLLGAWTILATGCAAIPPQISQLHQREADIMTALEASHLAMVDAYIDKKIADFEAFFFSDYGPTYLAHWRKNFKALHARDYDEVRDFSLLYSDLVAEYQEESAPIERARKELRAAIAREYRHAREAHYAVGEWLASMEEPSSGQRSAVDRLLGSIKPGLTLDSVDSALGEAMKSVRGKLAGM